MRKIYLVYEIDAWHSYASFKIIGVCTTFLHCMKVIRKYIKEFDRDKLSDDDKFNLKNIMQTQGRQCNYLISEVYKNTML